MADDFNRCPVCTAALWNCPTPDCEECGHRDRLKQGRCIECDKTGKELNHDLRCIVCADPLRRN
jgi:hypothetical protein